MKNVEWGEFIIGSLFKIAKTKSFNKDKLTDGFEYDYVTRTSENQGILQQTGFVNKHNINKAGNWSLGLLQMDFFYRNKPWYAGQFVRKITAIKEFPETSLRFITSSLNKLKPILLEVLVRNVESKFLNEKIQLPIKNGKIAFDFMASFVAEIENERILKLENYLSEIGLSDYHLTEKETQALENYTKLNWCTFNLENLFGKSTRGRRLKSADRVAGTLPFITAGETDEGVSAFIGNDVKVFSANTTTIDMFGSAKYRNFKYGGDDHIAVVHTDKLPKYASVFVTSAIHKSSYNGQFNYGRNFYAKDADALYISLPVKDGKPDYGTMETVISAIHKLVIKNVVLYVERKKKELNKLTENANA